MKGFTVYTAPYWLNGISIKEVEIKCSMEIMPKHTQS
jgi:hypothetical protein